jgi:hypothetical protein
MSNPSHYYGISTLFANAMTTHSSTGFWAFYRDHFLAEHQHPVNRGLHIFGTLLGTAFVPAALLSPWVWLVVLYPAVHAAPGLIGHRLFERNAQVGDVRVLRKDFSPLWFIAGNHVLTYEVAVAGLRRLVGRGPI